jgi:hypothetical protein
MSQEQSTKPKFRQWTWFLGALIGFLALGGWQPIFNYSDWSYYITCDASKGSQTEAFDALALWLFGSFCGASIGTMIAFLFDVKRVKSLKLANAGLSHESALDSSSQNQSASDGDCKT